MNTGTNPAAYSQIHESWQDASVAQRLAQFESMPLADAQEFYRQLSTRHQYEILANIPVKEQTVWVRLLDPDDAADLILETPPEERGHLLSLLDDTTRNDVQALLKYREDVAGGLMSPRFARVRPDMTVSEALTYVRQQALQAETIYAIYVLDAQQHLLGVMSLRALFAAEPMKIVSDVMRTNVVKVSDQVDQEQLSRLFAEHDLIAIPVVDDQNKIQGVVTVDDIVDVVQEEATEDIQKMGGTEALGAPYLEVSMANMLRKRAGWLTVLFFGELLTANAMAFFEHELEKAVVLAMFVPLIISSGGNSGSQASTLVIRAMALGEVRLSDWWRIMRREVVTGLALGTILGALGFARVVLGQQFFGGYGEHAVLIGLTVGLSLIGIVTWGSLSGSLLPLVLRKAGFDPASASAPFVATLVDVTGIVIYFSIAAALLTGRLL